MKKLYCIFGTAVVIVCATVIYMKPFHAPTADSSVANLLLANVEALAEDEGGDSNVIKDAKIKRVIKEITRTVVIGIDPDTGQARVRVETERKEISCCVGARGCTCDLRLHNSDC